MPRPPSPTHFLSIHLASPQLSRSLSLFRADVTSPNGFALHPAAVRPLGTMHLTLGVMALTDESSLTSAREVLRSVRLSDCLRAARGAGQAERPQDEKLKITLKGLHALNDPSKTSVVYIPPEDPQGTLYKFCNSIRDTFIEAGLITEKRELLLHATVVNTIYVPGQRGSWKGGKGKMTIDATGMVNGYDGFVWLEGMEVQGVRLCKMGAKKVEGEEGERYETVEEVKF